MTKFKKIECRHQDYYEGLHKSVEMQKTNSKPTKELEEKIYKEEELFRLLKEGFEIVSQSSNEEFVTYVLSRIDNS